MFVQSIKERVWGNLSGQEDTIHALLEATAMDPRFKGKMENDATCWDRLRKAALAPADLSEEGETDMEETVTPLYKPRSALEDLFAGEDRELRTTMQQNTLSIMELVLEVLKRFRAQNLQ